MNMNHTLKDLMHPPKTIPQNLHIKDLVKKFLDTGNNAFIVVNPQQKPIGVITRTDVLRHTIQAVSHKDETEIYRKSDANHPIPLLPPKAQYLPAEKIMSPKIFTFPPNETWQKAAKFMLQEGMKQIFVQDENQNIIGEVNLSDLVKLLLQQAQT